MPSRIVIKTLIALMFAFHAANVMAQMMPNPYGPPISLGTAKKVSAPALAEATKKQLDYGHSHRGPGRHPGLLREADNTQLGCAEVAVEKARSAALFKRPTKAFQDTLTTGGDGLRTLHLKGAVAVEGGVPLLEDGKIIGAIGVSGGTSQQDGQCAKAGADALK